MKLIDDCGGRIRCAGVMMLATAAIVCLSALRLTAADYSVKATKDPAKDLVSAEVGAQLAPGGYAVMRGQKRTVCEVWFRKGLPAKEDFEPTSTIVYPIEVGELVGVIRFKRKTTDFRDQEIPAGAYTMRFGLQPVDGNHVGTSDTRDFLLLLPADADISPERLTQENMYKLSKQAAGSKHPANLYLVKPGGPVQSPAVRHVEGRDWWTLQANIDAAKGGEKMQLPFELVVVGVQIE